MDSSGSEVPSVGNGGEINGEEGEEPSSSMISVNGRAGSEIGVNLESSQATRLSSMGTSLASPPFSSAGGATSSMEIPNHTSDSVISWVKQLDTKNNHLKARLVLTQQVIAEKDATIHELNMKLMEAEKLIEDKNRQLDIALGKEVGAEEKFAKLKNSIKILNESYLDKFENVKEHLLDEEDQQSMLGQGQNAKKTLQENVKEDNPRKHVPSGHSEEAVGDQSSPTPEESDDSIQIVEEGSEKSSDPLKLPNPRPSVFKSSEANKSHKTYWAGLRRPPIEGPLPGPPAERKISSEPVSTAPIAKDIAMSKIQPGLKIASRQSKAMGQTTPKVTTKTTSEEGRVAMNHAEDIAKRNKSAKEIVEPPLVGDSSHAPSSFETEFETTDLPVSGGLRSEDVRECLNEPNDDEHLFEQPLSSTQPIYLDDDDNEDSNEPRELRTQKSPATMPTRVSTKVYGKPVIISGNNHKHKMDMAKRTKGIFCICGNEFSNRPDLDAHIQFPSKRPIEPSSTFSSPSSKFLLVEAPGYELQIGDERRRSRRKQKLISRRVSNDSSPQMSNQTIPILVRRSAAAPPPSPLHIEEEEDVSPEAKGQKNHGFDTEKLKLGLFHCICGKKCRKEEKLQAHITYGERELKFFCEVCGKGFPFRSLLTNHLPSHKIGGGDRGMEVNSTHKAKRQKSECTKCGKIFQTQADLMQHNRLKHELKSVGKEAKSGVKKRKVRSTISPRHQVSSSSPTVRARKSVQR